MYAVCMCTFVLTAKQLIQDKFQQPAAVFVSNKDMKRGFTGTDDMIAGLATAVSGVHACW